MDLKFVSHRLWSKKQNILLPHMLKKEFCILTNKCGNNLKHENEAENPWPFGLVFMFKIIYTCVEEGCSASLTIAREKQT